MATGSGDTATDPIRARATADRFLRGPAGADLIDKVDFSLFVADPVAGVFQSNLDARIEQMQAYADLVKGVAKTTARLQESPCRVLRDLHGHARRRLASPANPWARADGRQRR